MKTAHLNILYLVLLSQTTCFAQVDSMNLTPDLKNHLANGWKKITLEGLWEKQIKIHEKNLLKPDSIYLLYEAEHEAIWYISVEIHEKAVVGYVANPNPEGIKFSMVSKENMDHDTFDALIRQLESIAQIRDKKISKTSVASPYRLRIFLSTKNTFKQMDVEGAIQFDEQSPLGRILISLSQ